jgi:hypothetical protein
VPEPAQSSRTRALLAGRTSGPLETAGGRGSIGEMLAAGLSGNAGNAACWSLGGSKISGMPMSVTDMSASAGAGTGCEIAGTISAMTAGC